MATATATSKRKASRPASKSKAASKRGGGGAAAKNGKASASNELKGRSRAAASSRSAGTTRARAGTPRGRSARARPATQQAAGRAGLVRGAKRALESTTDRSGPTMPQTIKLAWRAARVGLRLARGKRPKAKQLRKAASSAGEVGVKALAQKAPKLPLRKLSEVLSEVHVQELPEHIRRLPVQRSIDVGVPVEVAFEEWMRLDSLPEGAHRVVDVERRQGRLLGQLNGLGPPRDWEAEIRDERPNESFAWRSTQGSDVAGLITFHSLSERLTRLELQLDVVPTRFGEAASLALHLADRRAESELRRFKARVETISPDAYPSLTGQANRKPSKPTKKKED